MKSESTRQIPRVRDKRLIRGLFGSRAVPYDYTVTQRDWDERDNEAPGHYYGITVPASLADRWDAGLLTCKARGLLPSSRAGLLVRYRIMVGDPVATLPAELDTLAAEREAAEAAKRSAQAAADDSPVQ